MFVGQPQIVLAWLLGRYEGETCEGRFHGEGLAYFEGGHMYKVHVEPGF